MSDNEALVRRIEEAINQKGFPVRRDGGLITHVNGVYVGVWVMPVGRTAKTVLRMVQPAHPGVHPAPRRPAG